MHAKLILADGELAFVGSQNFSATSLDQNREVGVVIADTSALHVLSDAFGRSRAVREAA
ncbi:MAG TPA: phospholipase D-like domain-containing protein [Ktedonobacterales bacterium]|jgi:phosphatidylserine/phosphatidylglycerophosphate/cardiolipin synthase-like enzyme|nr:phospholipase D-like domain-containing protein [Ktedonobacterales bacterium]